jgi:hypothetical protein
MLGSLEINHHNFGSGSSKFANEVYDPTEEALDLQAPLGTFLQT